MPREWGFSSFLARGVGVLNSFFPRGGEFAHQKNCPGGWSGLELTDTQRTRIIPKENVIDIIALNETFLNKKLNFHITGYDTIRNDRSTGQGTGVAFLVKHGLVINKEYRNGDFNIKTENEALAINLELSNN